MENLKIILSKVGENFYGVIINIIVANIKMELNMVLEFMFLILKNLMFILVFGNMEKPMELELKLMIMICLFVFGKKEKN